MSDEDEIMIDEFLDGVEQNGSDFIGSDLDQENEDENINNSIEQETEIQEQSNILTREDIYKSVYQAITDANEQDQIDNNVVIDDEPKTEQEFRVSNLPESYSSNSVEFATNTDAKYYTVETSGSVGSADEQLVAYMLDTRNIMIIGFSIIILLQFYKIIKGTFLKLVKGKGKSI